MTNKIQIKRSTSNSTVIGLSNGELAFTQAGNTLHIGLPDGSGVLRIGGAMVPGTLTANQALVANSTSGIDKVIVANLVPTSVWANGTAGTDGQLLTSNGSVVYWNTPAPSVVGSDTQVQFNDGGSLGADSGLTFNKTTDTLSTNNVFVISTVNAETLSVGTSFTANSTLVNAVSANIGGGVIANSSGIFPTSNSVGLDLGGANHRWFLLANGAGFSGNISVQGTGSISTLNVGSSAITGNSTRLSLSTAVGIIANGTIGTAGQVLHSNGTTVYWETDDQGVTSVETGNGMIGGTITSTGTVSVLANNGIVANSTGVFAKAANGISVDTSGINVVGGDGLVSNASGVHVGAGNGISVSADAIAVTGGSTLTVNTAGVHVNSDLSITSLTTSGDVTVNGNTKLGDTSSDVVSIIAGVNTSITPSSNVTYDLGGNLLRWNNVYSNHVESVSGEFTGNLTVGGDLTVTGNVTTINVSSLSVSDPLIKLAVNNTVSDTLYIGFTGHYNGAGNTTNHAGLVRSPVDKDFYLFSTYGDEIEVGNNIINVADPSFTLANLTSYLLSGGLVTNVSHVAITANSTVNVSIVSNTLTLSSPLSGTSGGTGKSTMTSEAILVGNTTNGYNELALGTAGHVLQSNGTALIYSILDGGEF